MKLIFNTPLVCAALLTLTTLIASTAAAAEPVLSVHQPWVRLAPPNAPATAGFMVLKNPSAQPIKVVAVESNVAQSNQLHSHQMIDGMMAMREVDNIQVPAHGEVALAPGSFHVMLIGMKAPLKEGAVVTLTLILADGKKVLVQAPVQRKP